MPNCECLPKCPFFNDNMQNMPSIADMMKKRYCLGSNEDCARYMVFKSLGREKVPMDLFPNMTEDANRLINGK